MDSRFQPSGETEVNPGLWWVRLDGCDSTAPERIIHYTWLFEGAGHRTPTCRSGPIKFTRLGWQQVGVTIETADGKQRTFVQWILLRDFLVVSMGDSIASGEGGSYNSRGDADWTDKRCHRSNYGVHPKVAQELERRDPHTAVTFLHVACSGASIWEGGDGDGGLLTPYRGIARGRSDSGFLPP